MDSTHGARRSATQRVPLLAVSMWMLLSLSCSGVTSPEQRAPTRVPLPAVPTKPTHEVRRGEVVKTLEFNGRIVPVVEEELFFRSAGYVAEVYVRSGDIVESGALLAELDTSDLQNQLSQARVDLETLRKDAEWRSTEADANLTVAQLQLAKITAHNPHAQTVIAEVALERAQEALSSAEEEYQVILDSPSSSQELAEAAAERVHQAELDVRVADADFQQTLAYWQQEALIAEQEVALARLRLEQATADLDIQSAELGIERLEDQLADARVTAPFQGQVMSVRVSAGRTVDAYRGVMVIADPTRLEVKADLPGANASQLVKDMLALLTVANRPGEEMQGYVRRVPQAGGGQNETEGDGSVRVALGSTPHQVLFESGDIVWVTVELARTDEVLWVPPQAIRSFEGRQFVLVQESDGSQRRVDVILGLEGDGRVEIEDGLHEGQVVVSE